MTPQVILSDMKTNLYADLNVAICHAVDRANLNGAPVGVLLRDGWYRIEECADRFELLQDVEHWQQVTVVDPDETV